MLDVTKNEESWHVLSLTKERVLYKIPSTLLDAKSLYMCIYWRLCISGSGGYGQRKGCRPRGQWWPNESGRHPRKTRDEKIDGESNVQGRVISPERENNFVLPEGLRIHWFYRVYREIRPPSPKRCFLGMTSNWMWWWGSSSKALGNVEYLLIAITPGLLLPRLVVSVRVAFMGQIDLFEND